MVPPSIHPDGQQLSFEEWHHDAPHHSYNSLQQLVHRIGAAALIMRSWKRGTRHQLSLCLAGLCQSLDMSFQDTAEFVRLVCIVTNDEEQDSRLNNVELTFERPRL